jgi:HSP20 family protein
MSTVLTRFLAPLEWLGRVMPDRSGIRIEDRTEDQRYILRAQIPGVDPTTDLHLTTTDNVLRLEVSRSASKPDALRSEFHYGKFVRTIPLPPDVVADTISATYDRGVLEITMALAERGPSGREIPVRPVVHSVDARSGAASTSRSRHINRPRTPKPGALDGAERDVGQPERR